MHKNVMLMDEYAHREAMDKRWGRDVSSEDKQ
ncbi:hypothetical protein EGH57_20635 [Klebsiella aerogenes]|nr:hypothetical protein EGH57_20635 [Klebsiella aerogenes]